MPLPDTIRNAANSPRLPAVAAIVAIIIVIAAAAWFGLFTALVHSRWLWPVVIIVAALIALAVIVWGIPWFREWRFVHGESSQFPVAGGESPQEFQNRFVSALRRFRSLPQNAGKGDSLYALPWYVMIGSERSGKTALLGASGLFSPLTSVAAEGGTQNCDWWVSNGALVLDTAGRYATQADQSRDRAEWYRLLHLVRHYRGREPLNGIVVAIAADGLVAGPDEKLRIDGGKIRERVEEAIQQLGGNFPLYVIVAKCDLIEGFAEFFGLLPERVFHQAVGFVDDPPAGSGAPPRGAEAMHRFQSGLHSVYERLNLFRLSILNGKIAEAMTQPVFCFPEELRALERPLATFVAPLLSEDVRYHTPLFRGLFLTSAQQSGAPFSTLRRQLDIAATEAPAEGKGRRDYFLHDLFEIILPRDRTLGAIVTPGGARP
ncbi:MAG: type VI secretion protein IcmF/TssM N-terminal domain-containing protein [Candidatus Binataceae bacterium]